MSDDVNPNDDAVQDDGSKMVPLPGFENFGEEEYEMVDMVRKAVLNVAEVITLNCIKQEVALAQDGNGAELPQEFVDHILHQAPVSQPLHNLISLGVYAGTQAMGMVQVAMGMINIPVVMQNQPQHDGFQDLIASIVSDAVSVYKVGKDEDGNTKIEPHSFDPEKDETPSPVDRSNSHVLPYGEQEEVASEVARKLGTDEEK